MKFTMYVKEQTAAFIQAETDAKDRRRNTYGKVVDNLAAEKLAAPAAVTLDPTPPPKAAESLKPEEVEATATVLAGDPIPSLSPIRRRMSS